MRVVAIGLLASLLGCGAEARHEALERPFLSATGVRVDVVTRPHSSVLTARSLVLSRPDAALSLFGQVTWSTGQATAACERAEFDAVTGQVVLLGSVQASFEAREEP